MKKAQIMILCIYDSYFMLARNTIRNDEIYEIERTNTSVSGNNFQPIVRKMFENATHNHKV